MPNSAVWGNPNTTQLEQQDFITPPSPAQGDHAILRINDVNVNDADRAAIYAKNSNNGTSARAFAVTGRILMSQLFYFFRKDSLNA
jgi:hypothetical protein